MGELAAVALMTGARFTGPIVTLVFGLIILRRVAVEEKTLSAILAPIHTPTAPPRNR
jgi:isoprenylcysteine carboxyl methyltransferase (ICMT) family protein YpbQ